MLVLVLVLVLVPELVLVLAEVLAEVEEEVVQRLGPSSEGHCSVRHHPPAARLGLGLGLGLLQFDPTFQFQD